MAYTIRKTCKRCFEEFDGVESANIQNDFCGKCSPIVEQENKEKRLKEWRGDLSLEERVAKLEEYFLANQNHQHFGPNTIIG
jgi:hypothetical protein